MKKKQKQEEEKNTTSSTHINPNIALHRTARELIFSPLSLTPQAMLYEPSGPEAVNLTVLSLAYLR